MVMMAEPRQRKSFVALGQRVAALRLAKRWSQEDLAAATEISQSYISHIEQGRRRRLVKPSPNVMAAIRKYLRAHERACTPVEDDGALWQALGGELAYSGLYAMVRRMGQDAGLHMHPHLLRHSFATNYLEEGDRHSLQLLLGHSDPKTTSRYVASKEQERALRAHEKYSPGKGLRLG